MTMVQRYNEHPAAALTSVLPHLKRIGATLSGILGNDDHTYGYHLSKDRLLGTGRTSDKSLFGTANVPCADDRAGCAIDIGMDWQASGEWLEWVRAERAAGRLAQITELIGDPDKLPGAPRDIKDACYASASTGWRWVEYTGQGHVTWCHVGIGRRHANDGDFGNQLLGGWSATGPTKEDDMTPEQANTLNGIYGRVGEVYGIRNTLKALSDVVIPALAELRGMSQAEMERDLAEAERRAAAESADAQRDAELVAELRALDPGDTAALEALLARIRVTVEPDAAPQ